MFFPFHGLSLYSRLCAVIFREETMSLMGTLAKVAIGVAVAKSVKSISNGGGLLGGASSGGGGLQDMMGALLGGGRQTPTHEPRRVGLAACWNNWPEPKPRLVAEMPLRAA
jgi:hypothetical protein